MKRLISIVLTLLILATAIPFATAFAAEATYPTTPQEPEGLNPYKDVLTIDATHPYTADKWTVSGTDTTSAATVTTNGVNLSSTYNNAAYTNSLYKEGTFDLSNGFVIKYDVNVAGHNNTTHAANNIFYGVGFGGYGNGIGTDIRVGLANVGTFTKSNGYDETVANSKMNDNGLRLVIGLTNGKQAYASSDIIVGGKNEKNIADASKTLGNNISIFMNNKATMHFEIVYDAAAGTLTASVLVGGETYTATAKMTDKYPDGSTTLSERADFHKSRFSLFSYTRKTKPTTLEYSNVKLQSKYDAGINLSVTNNLNFNVRLYDLDTENFTAEFIRHGQNGDATETVNVRTTGTYSYFTFSDIAPQCIGDNVSVVIKDGAGNPVYYGYTSIKEYLNTLLNDNQSSGELKTLCKDLLAYGAAARKYKSYGDDSLDSYIDQGASFSTDGAADASVIDTEGKGKWTEGTVVFDSALKLKVKFKADTSVFVTGAKFNGADCNYSYSESDNTYTIASANIYASNLTDDHTFVLTTSNGDTTLTYSLGAYIKYIDSNSADANFKTLVQRTWMFAKAANAYAIAQQ